MAELGFYPSNSGKVPTFVEDKAVRSVFRLYVPDGSLKKLNFQQNQYDEVIARLEKKIREDSSYELLMLIPQLRKCQSMLANECMVWNFVQSGTSFVAGSETRLWSAYHVIRDFIESDASGVGGNLSVGIIKTVRLPILIVDSRGTPIFISSKGQEARIRTINGGVAQYKKGETNNDFFDYVELEFPIKLGPILEISEIVPSVGSPVFIGGFPEKTSDHAASHAPDADGKSFRFMIGNSIGVEEAFKRRKLDVNNYATPEQKDFVNTYAILSTADGNDGTSGAPIFNDEGKVVGIHVASWRLGRVGLEGIVNQGTSFRFIGQVQESR